MTYLGDIPYEQKISMSKLCALGGGCGSVGRADASDTTDPRLLFRRTFVNLLTKRKEKEAGNIKILKIRTKLILILVSVPPEKPLIRDRHGQEMLTYDIGPYEIEQDLILECEVTGGEALRISTF